MLPKRPQVQERGFTLIELLIVVVIIGIVMAIIIPNLMDAMQKAKQRRTVNDVRAVGTAWFSWVTDQLSASAAGSSSQEFDMSRLPEALEAGELLEMLRRGDMNYLVTIPEKDGWGGIYQYSWAGDAALSWSVTHENHAVPTARTSSNDLV